MHNNEYASKEDAQKVIIKSFELVKLAISSKELLIELKKTSKNSEVNASAKSARNLIILLADHYNHLKDGMYPRLETMAERLGLTVRSVSRILLLCIQAGLISKDKMEVNHSKNIYYFTDKFWALILANSEKVLKKKEWTFCPLKNQNTRQFVHPPLYKEQIKTDLTNKGQIISKNDLTESDKKKYDQLQFFNQKEDFIKSKNREAYEQRRSEDFKQKFIQESENSSGPLDFDKESAIKYINDLHPLARRNSIFVRQLKEKWSLNID